jgi:hypothetical protein
MESKNRNLCSIQKMFVGTVGNILINDKDVYGVVSSCVSHLEDFHKLKVSDEFITDLIEDLEYGVAVEDPFDRNDFIGAFIEHVETFTDISKLNFLNLQHQSNSDLYELNELDEGFVNKKYTFTLDSGSILIPHGDPDEVDISR